MYISLSFFDILFGFNGKEKDDESGWQDYGMRMYDTRLGRFFSVDPISHSYPWLTPYQFASNSPIESIDLDGAEQLTTKKLIPYGKEIKIKKINSFRVYNLSQIIQHEGMNYKVVGVIKHENQYQSFNGRDGLVKIIKYQSSSNQITNLYVDEIDPRSDADNNGIPDLDEVRQNSTLSVGAKRPFYSIQTHGMPGYDYELKPLVYKEYMQTTIDVVQSLEVMFGSGESAGCAIGLCDCGKITLEQTWKTVKEVMISKDHKNAEIEIQINLSKLDKEAAKGDKFELLRVVEERYNGIKLMLEKQGIDPDKIKKGKLTHNKGTQASTIIIKTKTTKKVTSNETY